MRSAITLLSIGLAGCVGKAPTNPTADAPPAVADAEPDATVNTAARVSGKTMDYFGNVALQATGVATDGIDPPLSTTSAADGAYSIDVAVGSKLFLVGTRSLYRPTRNAPLSVLDVALTQDVYLLTIQDVRNQYTGAGKTPTAGTAFVIADLRNGDGTPVVGIPLANVVLHDALDQPVTGVFGPYFFNAQGALDPAQATSVADASVPPRSRVAYLDVPPGTYALAVTSPAVGGGNVVNHTSITAAADGATIALSGGTAVTGTAATDPLFSTDIYPRLQRAANGGLGCANCHTAGGPAAVLKYDDPEATVFTNIKGITGIVDVVTPANSLLLHRPLYELPPAVQDHPNATFLDTNDPDYKLFLLWIANGAKP